MRYFLFKGEILNKICFNVSVQNFLRFYLLLFYSTNRVSTWRLLLGFLDRNMRVISPLPIYALFQYEFFASSIIHYNPYKNLEQSEVTNKPCFMTTLSIATQFHFRGTVKWLTRATPSKLLKEPTYRTDHFHTELE